MVTAASPGRRGHITVDFGSSVLIGSDTFTGVSGTALTLHNSDVGFGSPGWGPTDNSFFQLSSGRATQLSGNQFLTKTKTATNVISDGVTSWCDVFRPASTNTAILSGFLARGSTAIGANDDHIHINYLPDTASGSPLSKVKIQVQLIVANTGIQTSTGASGVSWPVSSWNRLGMILSSGKCTPFLEPFGGGQRVSYSTITLTTGLNNATHLRYGLYTKNIAGQLWDNLTVWQTTVYNRLGEIIDYVFTNSRTTPIDATSNDSSGTEENVPQVMDWTARVRMYCINTDGAQRRVRNAILGSTKLNLVFKPSTNSYNYNGNGTITGAKVLSATRDAVTMDVDVRGTGSLTFTS